MYVLRFTVMFLIIGLTNGDEEKIDLTIRLKRIGFHARLTAHKYLSPGQKVVFNKAITNIGNHYDTKTGIFTAAVDGMYFFTSTFIKQQYSRELHLQMMKNSEEITRGHAALGGGANSGSMSAVVFLKAGDAVYIRLYPGVGHQTIHGDWSFFSGYLII